MAISEQPVAAHTRLALEALNDSGGLLGRRIEIVEVDTESDASRAAQAAQALIEQSGVSVLFGCWTSACRRSVRAVVEAKDSLLIYPLQFEGLEASAHVLHTGLSSNQQITPAVRWAVHQFGPRVALIASDYIYPRLINHIIEHQISALGGSVVASCYLSLGDDAVTAPVALLGEARPDVVLNTLNGSVNVDFFAEYARAGPTAPVLSFSIGEADLEAIGPAGIGHYAAWQHFTPGGGGGRAADTPPLDGASHSAITGVGLWAAAVRLAHSAQAGSVRTELVGLQLQSSDGITRISATHNSLWHALAIGRANDAMRFDTVWRSEGPIPPRPYPAIATRGQWEWMISNWYRQWGERWSAPMHDAPQC